MVQGVDAHVNGDRLLFHISGVTPDFENLVRNHLSLICYGMKKASSGRESYSYKNTLREFLERYKAKNETTKIGMIGELVAHVFLLEYKENFVHASPYFNLEERSIKKGYDLVLFDKVQKEIWVTEVKSGQLHKDKDADGTCADLIGNAKRDLIGRLNERGTALWQNAINAAMVSLGGVNNFADLIDDMLHKIDEQHIKGNTDSKDRNVVLTACLFAPLDSDKISTKNIDAIHRKIEAEKAFKCLLTLAFQKGTVDAIVRFLEKEAR